MQTKAGSLGPGQSLAQRLGRSTSYKGKEFVLKEPRAIIETSMAGVKDILAFDKS